MLVAARSFSYQSRPTPQSKSSSKGSTTKDKKQEKEDAVRRFGWRPPSFEKYTADVNPSKHTVGAIRAVGHDMAETRSPSADISGTTHDSQPLKEALAEGFSPVLRHSEPVAVPSHRKSKGPRSQDRTSRGSIGSMQEAHDTKSPSPSVAALLAVTTIPKKKRFPRQNDRRSAPRTMSSSELVEEWRQMDAEDKKYSVSPTMDVLLSPPDAPSLLDRRLSDDDMIGHGLHSRSESSESMPSLVPGCDLDDTSIYSLSMPPTPEIQGRRPSRLRKERGQVSPSSAECALDDHPLLGVARADEDQVLFIPAFDFSPPHPPVFKPTKGSDSKPTSFKSNLTASLMALRTAARSFSNFAAPSIPPDDHLTRGIFGSPPYRSEMRPRRFDGPPTPELRRYLNPLPPQHHLAPTDFHLHGSHLDHTDLEAAAAAFAGLPHQDAAVIPLQTYFLHPPVPTSSDSEVDATASPAATEANRTLPQRHREPRENGEFLRVLVLELNMRRSGKLEDGMGRARFWLPPRAADSRPQPDTAAAEGDAPCPGNSAEQQKSSSDRGRRVQRRVPRRWRSISADAA